MRGQICKFGNTVLQGWKDHSTASETEICKIPFVQPERVGEDGDQAKKNVARGTQQLGLLHAREPERQAGQEGDAGGEVMCAIYACDKISWRIT